MEETWSPLHSVPVLLLLHRTTTHVPVLEGASSPTGLLKAVCAQEGTPWQLSSLGAPVCPCCSKLHLPGVGLVLWVAPESHSLIKSSEPQLWIPQTRGCICLLGFQSQNAFTLRDQCEGPAPQWGAEGEGEAWQRRGRISPHCSDSQWPFGLSMSLAPKRAKPGSPPQSSKSSVSIFVLVLPPPVPTWSWQEM